MARSTISIPDDLNDQIEGDLTYGDSKSEWIRKGIELRFAVQPHLNELYDLDDWDRKIEFVEAAVKRAVEEELDMGEIRGHSRRLDDLDPDR